LMADHLRHANRELRFQCVEGHEFKRYVWVCGCGGEIVCACGQPASPLLPKVTRNAQLAEPTTYAVDPATGHLWVPGRRQKKPPKGYVSHEIRTWRDRDEFYKKLRVASDTMHEDFALRHEAEFGALIDDGHSRLRDYLAQDHIPEIDKATNQPTGRMIRLTEEGRGLLRMALERPGYERPAWSGAEASIEAWENSNTSYCDEDTGWHDRQV
jgi:hypothetical protein